MADVNFPDLLQHLPEWFKPVLEYKEIMKAHGYSYSVVDGEARAMLMDFFIQTCDLETLRYYEKLLDIAYQSDQTIEERRAQVLALIGATQQFTEIYFRQRLAALVDDDYSLTVDPVRSVMDLSIGANRYAVLETIFRLCYSVVPAHIDINHAVAFFSGQDLYFGIGYNAEKTIDPLDYDGYDPLEGMTFLSYNGDILTDPEGNVFSV